MPAFDKRGLNLFPAASHKRDYLLGKRSLRRILIQFIVQLHYKLMIVVICCPHCAGTIDLLHKDFASKAR